ncbi:hypothetical protein [Bradyrhizobium sp. BTAi1]|jgi:hypothetical protein|uniref:hypothetical protein n=1 Tax=Bradyrhizobium sp. (strain BTAi1 / ATCC BAA-1182) TaxID=288000 RepID=UPI00143A0908|nr:hypothetical protein [Bradyrhizobium sp. BTAi1]
MKRDAARQWSAGVCLPYVSDRFLPDGAHGAEGRVALSLAEPSGAMKERNY